ncbi:MAG: hypothetical protein E6Q97_24235 [Desulfurellales bacterium]|nr:MAG: hypothetical protein E6Q97_24235 [Desulfurellales bacterium]
MADLAKTVAILFKAQDQASSVVDKLADNLKAVSDNAGGSSGKVDDLAKSTERLGRTSGQVEALSTAMKALAASMVFKAFVDANVEVEKFERSMTLLKGSSEAATQEFQYIAGVARTLGLNLFETADAYVQLSAATKGTALEGAQTREVFEAVAKAMSSLGKSSADTQGALLAVSQMVSKGTVSMEELRGQLGERLPGAFQAAAQAMGLTTKELDALVSSGKLSTEEFLPKFAEALRDTFGETKYVDGYAASFNRLQNSISEAFVEIGKAGSFDALTKGVQAATAAVVGATATFRLLGEVAGIVVGAIASQNFSGVGEAVDEAMTRAANSTRGARDALFGLKDEAQPTAAATEQVAQQVDKVADTSDAAAKALGELGVKAKDVKPAFDVLANAFDELAKAGDGQQILAGLDKVLKSADSLSKLARVGDAVKKAYADGRLSVDEFATATRNVEDRQAAVEKALGRTSTSLVDQAKAMAKAEENAAKLHLEMEKLASNERIKTMEFKAQIDVARIQADAEKVKAAFASISTGIDSTGDVLKSLFGMFDKLGSLDSSAYRAVFDQINAENRLREESFDLQKRLTEAQIDNMRAQTRRMETGDALIKIDGAGLQPHLEAFMWEILRTIQTRVNRDGLKMLLGVGP